MAPLLALASWARSARCASCGAMAALTRGASLAAFSANVPEPPAQPSPEPSPVGVPRAAAEPHAGRRRKKASLGMPAGVLGGPQDLLGLGPGRRGAPACPAAAGWSPSAPQDEDGEGDIDDDNSDEDEDPG
ncbi:unnamed protein product [Prorocentrum cordatum]|uniref:Uncharacterized protein n=1 Tax=Prorocentrum cordatum TaxID=2364126 RepID=A0ABN9RIW2_9DINO|nr:unnamed protein product [Polarella glacialis]